MSGFSDFAVEVKVVGGEFFGAPCVSRSLAMICMFRFPGFAAEVEVVGVEFFMIMQN